MLAPPTIFRDSPRASRMLYLFEELNAMDVSKITPGRNPPDEIHVVVEIPQGGVPIKYELDTVSGALFVNRFLHTAMFYPVNYGFIPNTLSEDGDPADAMVLSQLPVAPAAVIRCRPLGALMMEDENGVDEKILAVPVDELNPYFDGLNELADLPPIVREQIDHFFRHYKDLEKGKWAKVNGWVDRAAARDLISQAIARHPKK
jgi:inorganic pyrophosphatase